MFFKYIFVERRLLIWSLVFFVLLLLWNSTGLFFEDGLTELVAGLAFEVIRNFQKENVCLYSDWLEINGDRCNIWSIWSNKYGIRIGAGCNGLAILLLYFWFILIQGGYSVWRKLKYVVIGFAVLTLSNSLRLVALFYLSVIPTFWFEIVHKWVFQGIMYILMFGLWFLFLKEKKRI